MHIFSVSCQTRQRCLAVVYSTHLSSGLLPPNSPTWRQKSPPRSSPSSQRHQPKLVTSFDVTADSYQLRNNPSKYWITTASFSTNESPKFITYTKQEFQNQYVLHKNQQTDISCSIIAAKFIMWHNDVSDQSRNMNTAHTIKIKTL